MSRNTLASNSQAQQQNEQLLQNTAQQFGVSVDAVRCLWTALKNGHGSMAQFSHPELGGSGQWMSGGMTMVGDMFNHNAKMRVDGICYALADAARQAAVTSTNSSGSFQSQYSGPSGSQPDLYANGPWWPEDLGSPNSSGAQNSTQYAYFANAHRLALNINGVVTLYDTLNHQIGGVSQQQSGDQSLRFTSQFGTVRLYDLPQIKISNGSNSSSTAQPQYDEPSVYVDANGSQQSSNSNQNYNSGQSQSQSGSYNNPVQNNPAPTNNQLNNNQSNSNSNTAPTIQPSSSVPLNTSESNKPQVSAGDAFEMLEKLGKLRDAGVLTNDEFDAKKSELLKRI